MTQGGLALALAVAMFVGTAGCSGGSSGGPIVNPGGGDPGDGGGNDPCSPYTFGATCPIALTPYGVVDVYFTAPGLGQGLVDISLTGSTTFAVGVLREPDGYQRACSDFTFGNDQSCVVVSNGGAGYHLFVFETEGFAGTTYVTIARSQSLGSAAKPVPVSTDSLVNGSVGANGESYFSFEATSAATHTIALTGLFTQLDWELYGDPEFVDTVQLCTFASHQPELACRASLAGGATYYLRVRERSGAPQEFQLSIGSGAGDEGTPAAPVVLPVGGPSRVSTVDVFGHSYYTFTPTASGLHAIQLDGHSIVVDGFSYSFPSDFGWTLFEDPGFTTSVVKECRDYRQIRNGMEHCLAELRADVPYYLRVDEQAGYPNRAFELTVVSRTGGGGSGQGTVGGPVAISDQPITTFSGWGSVAALGSSYYSFQTAAGATDAAYRIIVVSEPDTFYFAGSNLSWALFDDAGFSHELTRCDRATGIVAQSCLTPGLSPSTTYYLRVDENDGIAQYFGLVVHGGRPPPTATSAQAPVSIPVGAAGIDVVQDNTLSTGFYTFATAAPGTYRVEANLATGDVYGLTGWTLYDDAAYSHEVVHCFTTGGIRTPGSSCTVALPAGTFYLKVQTFAAQSGYPSSTITGSDDLHLMVDAVP
jgi:hypothetical protein